MYVGSGRYRGGWDSSEEDLERLRRLRCRRDRRRRSHSSSLSLSLSLCERRDLCLCRPLSSPSAGSTALTDSCCFSSTTTGLLETGSSMTWEGSVGGGARPAALFASSLRSRPTRSSHFRSSSTSLCLRSSSFPLLLVDLSAQSRLGLLPHPLTAGVCVLSPATEDGGALLVRAVVSEMTGGGGARSGRGRGRGRWGREGRGGGGGGGSEGGD